MITVSIKKDEKGINKININGHAMYDDYGKDIVCASVSSITITTINAILRLDKDAITYSENKSLDITINKHTKEVDTLIINMIELLKDLEKQYGKNIKII